MDKIKGLWMPKRKECAAQCASCPFKVNNNQQWKKVVDSLRKKHGLKKATKLTAFSARVAIMKDVSRSGDFACHCTVYDADGEMRPTKDHRQCPGATIWFCNGKIKDDTK